MHTCVDTWAHVCLCMHVCTHVIAHMCMYEHAHMCTNVSVQVCARVCKHVHVRTHGCAFFRRVHVCTCVCTCVHVCAVSGRGRESRAEVGRATVRLPQSWQLRREPGRPLATTSEPGHQAAGRRVRAWSRPRLELMINQPSEAAQQLRPASRWAQAQGGSGAGSRGRWRPLCSPLGCGRRRRPAGPASEEQGVATQCPLSHGAGRRYGALGGRVMEAERAPSTEPGLATGGSELSPAFHFLREFSEVSGSGGNRTGVWRGRKAMGAG